MTDDETRAIRWRLILGRSAEQATGGLSDPQWSDRDQALEYLYSREYRAERNVKPDRQGSLDESQLTVPGWINTVHELFPKKTIERLEKDALERYGLDELVTNPDVLSRASPSESLLKAVLRTKHLMNQEVLAIARDLVRRMVAELMEKLAHDVKSPFQGAFGRRHSSTLRIAKNFDAATTLRKNLQHWDPEKKRLALKTPYFLSRVHRHLNKWQIIILVDQSGSMIDSVIHSAIMASIFFGMRAIKTHLCVFDTNVVDLTDNCSDPVETLMKVQLGGGTDIGKALLYAETLVQNPRHTIAILISDFCDGVPVSSMYRSTKRMVDSGITVLGLAALDRDANPIYDFEAGEKLVAVGAHVAAMTPGELAVWVAEKIG